jgi:hypothetical protein
VENLKDFLSHRRRNQPGWQLSQAEVDLAADLLAPCCRFTPRLICQATGGSLGRVTWLEAIEPMGKRLWPLFADALVDAFCQVCEICEGYRMPCVTQRKSTPCSHIGNQPAPNDSH